MLVNLEGPPLKSFDFLSAFQGHFLRGYRLFPLNGMVLISLLAYKNKTKKVHIITNDPSFKVHSWPPFPGSYGP